MHICGQFAKLKSCHIYPFHYQEIRLRWRQLTISRPGNCFSSNNSKIKLLGNAMAKGKYVRYYQKNSKFKDQTFGTDSSKPSLALTCPSPTVLVLLWIGQFLYNSNEAHNSVHDHLCKSSIFLKMVRDINFKVK